MPSQLTLQKRTYSFMLHHVCLSTCNVPQVVCGFSWHSLSSSLNCSSDLTSKWHYYITWIGTVVNKAILGFWPCIYEENHTKLISVCLATAEIETYMTYINYKKNIFRQNCSIQNWIAGLYGLCKEKCSFSHARSTLRKPFVQISDLYDGRVCKYHEPFDELVATWNITECCYTLWRRRLSPQERMYTRWHSIYHEDNRHCWQNTFKKHAEQCKTQLQTLLAYCHSSTPSAHNQRWALYMIQHDYTYRFRFYLDWGKNTLILCELSSISQFSDSNWCCYRFWGRQLSKKSSTDTRLLLCKWETIDITHLTPNVKYVRHVNTCLTSRKEFQLQVLK